MTHISVVIPVYNESRNIELCINSIKEVIKPLKCKYDIVLVDDGSFDDTWRIIKELSKEDTAIFGVRFTRNFGKEAAIRAGLEKAVGDAVIVIDADLQHPISLIPKMIEKWQQEDAKIVTCVKAKRQNESFIRRYGSLLFYNLFEWLSGMSLKNATDYKLLDRVVVTSYISFNESYLFFRGLSSWLGYKEVIIEFEPNNRAESESRWPLATLTRYALNSIVSFSTKPLEIITWLGMITFLSSVLLGGHTIAMKLLGMSEEGFPTVILLMLFIGSILIFGQGIIGQYIAKIYEEVKKRPRYVIGELSRPQGTSFD